MKTKRKETEILHLGPWKDLGDYKWVPGRTWSRGDVREERGNSTRRPCSTSRWAWRGLGRPVACRPRRAAGGGGCGQRRCRSGEGERVRSGRRASPRRGGPVPGFSWDRGRAESRAPRWSSSSGGNGGAAAPFCPRDGSARPGEGRGVEREGGTPLGEANEEGRARQEGGRSNRANSACARRDGVLAARE